MNLLRARDAVAGFDERGFRFLADNVHAQLDALIADEDRRAGDEFANLMLALAAEGTVKGVFPFAVPAGGFSADFAHWLKNSLSAPLFTRRPAKARYVRLNFRPPGRRHPNRANRCTFCASRPVFQNIRPYSGRINQETISSRR
jgi:hypothetical protein